MIRKPTIVNRLRKQPPTQTVMTPEQRVWLSVYTEIAGYIGSDGDTCDRWANKAVERFNDRFK